MPEIKPERIADAVSFTAINNNFFKTVRISVNFVLPLNAATAAQNAVLPFILCRGKDFTATKRRLENLFGAQLNPRVQKVADRQVLSIDLELVKSEYAKKDLLPEAAELLCELITKPPVRLGAFFKKDTDAEKQNVCGLILAEQNDKRALAIKRCTAIMFDGQPFGLDKYGELEQVAALDGKMLYAAWQNMLKTAVVEIIFIGADGTDEVKKIFAKHFGGKREPVSFGAIETPKPCEEYGEVEERMNITQAKLIMAYRTTEILPGDLKAFEVMRSLFGGSTTSKLFSNVREKLGLCYYCAATYNKFLGMLMVDSGVLEENVPKAREAINAQLKAICDGDFTDADVTDAKLYLQNIYRSTESSLQQLSAYWLSEILAGTMRSPNKAADSFDSVSRELIIAAAKSCWPDTVYLLAGTKEDTK
ncbi:MAG TPA: insulinase family protein [Oscillospiraceae bacterium]|nr:insulinase family protein [Oscillospiraceae bacterium]HPF56275.1 insulinase family protein [Clostridiales bacterium]HPK35395.1 insulinase family protein [Oscillospiraceae bacterium]HPR75312.1 insulinase family protein [Oscillospiraceae bacterium]